jgi:hypothetical protein
MISDLSWSGSGEVEKQREVKNTILLVRLSAFGIYFEECADCWCMMYHMQWVNSNFQNY